MGRKSSCKTHSLIFAYLSYILFPVQRLHRISVLSGSVALPPADEKKFLDMGRLLGILCDYHSAARCGFSCPHAYLDVASKGIPAQAGSLVWIGTGRHGRLILSLPALNTSHERPGSAGRVRLACPP